ncbi:NAD(P)-dependent oxidoreductase [Trueperella sp.]|uniref:NAD(P)-dependent oxidoreductase n=1 Tax=Trueperella sp. TaxID=2699835 RepID=UPI0022EB1BC8|nr:NAD(P)-dependent oxidoreductase [Trueperella sp.]
MKIAVIGLGAMGIEMATWLATTFDVVGYDVSEERMDLARERDVRSADSPSGACTDADVTLVAVRNRAQLDDLLYGERGIIDVLREGSALILTSTIGIAAVEEVAAQLSQHGIRFVDAPVSGGPVRAGKGDLLVTVGAYEADYDFARPVLDAMASTLVLVGKAPGKGQAMKTVNQLLCGVHIAAGAEALALAGKLGLDQEMALSALMSGAAESFMLGDRGPRAIQAFRGEEAEVKSRLDIFVKDMGIVTDAAKAAGIAVPVAAAAEQEYLMGLARGQGAMDDSSVIRVISPDALP